MFDLHIPCTTLTHMDTVISLNQVLYISLAYQKKVPKIIMQTALDEYVSKITGSLESLEILFGQFGFIRVDSGVMVNIHHFSHFEKDGYSQLFCFAGTTKKVVCSRAGYAKVKHAIENTT
ncbi:MAG: hypothetical protein K0Q90_456 [Paenibacillaceae bacterium]|nr:hypothetical protein [Paenibacillaceae bacterium]